MKNLINMKNFSISDRMRELNQQASKQATCVRVVGEEGRRPESYVCTERQRKEYLFS